MSNPFCELQLEEARGKSELKRTLVITTYKDRKKHRLVIGPLTAMQLDLLLAGEIVVPRIQNHEQTH